MITPDFSELLDNFMRMSRLGLRVAMPGKVTAYSQSRNTVNVEPQLKVPLESPDGSFEFEGLPIIMDVPILWPSGSGGDCFITWPLAIGDYVELLFNDFDIGVWRTQGEAGNPGDQRAHGPSGAVAIPGMRPNSQVLTAAHVHASKVVIGDGVLLGSANAAEAMVLGTAHKQEYDTHVHPTPMGPSGPPSVAMAALSTKHALDG